MTPYECINPVGSPTDRECGGIANYHSPQCRRSNTLGQYRAYCADPLCNWVSESAYEFEQGAYDDLNLHMQIPHFSVTGVKYETP